MAELRSCFAVQFAGGNTSPANFCGYFVEKYSAGILATFQVILIASPTKKVAGSPTKVSNPELLATKTMRINKADG
jgi:hypothetical protein